MTVEYIIQLLMGLVIGGLCYQLKRQDDKLSALDAELSEAKLESVKTYVRRDDCRFTHQSTDKLIANMDKKLDRLLTKGVDND